LEGSINLVECVDNPGICGRSKDCVTRKVWSELGKNISMSLAEITLKRMVEMQNRKEDTLLAYD